MLSSHRLLLLLVAVQGGPLPLTCPKGVTSFSATSKPGHFYSCGADGVATLSECPVGKVYHGFSQKCRNTEEKDRPKPIDEKSMGRNVVLGALFDARKNEYYNGLSPWLPGTVAKSKFKYDRKETTTSFASDTRTKDKADHFDISANLALDFMSGQVHVEGGMNYLSDEVSSEREIHVEMMYRTTKYTETMPKYIKKEYLEECNNPDITHVVTSVTYGMDANFVFKYLMSDYESKENIYGMLKLTVTAVPGLAIEGSGSVNMTSEQTEMMARTEIEVYGNYAGGTQVTDFESALKLYRELPSLGGTAPDWSGASILEVHLTPIVDICTDADFILNAINDGLVNSVTNMLSELELVGVKARGLSLRGAPQPENPLAVQFKPLGENLDLYMKGRDTEESRIKSELRKIIPNIRGGDGTGEEELVNLLGEYNASPFAFETSNQFLIRRNREISAVWYLTQSFPEDNDDNINIQIMDFESANDVDLFLAKDAVLLMELHILSPKNLTQNFVNGNPENEDSFWFNDVEMNGHIGSLLRNMSKFAWENDDSEENGYLVKLLEIEKDGNPNITVSGWQIGKQEDLEFVVPPAPEQASVYQVGHDSVKLSVKVFNKFTTGAKVMVTNAFDVTKGPQPKTINFTESLQPGDEMEITLLGLDAITLYTVSVQYLTNYGLSPPSPASPRFLTAPSSPPSHLAVTATTIDSLTVTWAQPEEMGDVEGEVIDRDDLSYSLMIQGENGYSETKVFDGPPLETTFSGLQDASNYIIEARAFYQDKTSGEEPATAMKEDSAETTTATANTTTTTPAPHRLAIPVDMISTSLPAYCGSYSNPTTPTMLPSLPGEVGLDSAIVMWELPSRVPENATEMFVTLAYAVAYGGGNGTYGDFIEVNVVGANKATVGDLVKNTLYVFKVKLVTNEGNSDFSSLLAVKTLDDETDLGKFEDEVMGRLDDLRNEAHKKSVFCASQNVWDTNSADHTVTYDKVFLSSVTNMVGAELDPGTGVFKAGASGSYMVSASMEMMIDSDQTHNVYIQKNGETLVDSKMSAHCDVNNFYCFSDNGAKDIVVALEAGDTLNLLTKKSEGLDIANIVFCVQSLKVL